MFVVSPWVLSGKIARSNCSGLGWRMATFLEAEGGKEGVSSPSLSP